LISEADIARRRGKEEKRRRGEEERVMWEG